MAEKEDRNDIIIEGSTARWDINVEGDINGLYVGSFRFRCFLTPTQRIACGKLYRELLGPSPTLALKHEDDLAFSLSQLKYRVISSPPFWSSSVGLNDIAGDIPDENVIDMVLNAAIDAEIKYKSQLKKRKLEVIEKAKKAAERLLSDQDQLDENEDQKSSD